jgi:hypothetical protein
MKNIYATNPGIKNIVEGGKLYAEQLKNIAPEEKAKLEA